MSGFRYMCDKCDLTFKCPKSLEDHANSVHEGEKSTLNKYLFNDIFLHDRYPMIRFSMNEFLLQNITLDAFCLVYIILLNRSRTYLR